MLQPMSYMENSFVVIKGCLHLLSTLSLFTLKGTVMQNKKTQINDRLSVSKLS